MGKSDSLLEHLLIRPATSSDHPYIFSTWLKWYKHYSYFAKKIRNTTYYTQHHILIERLLADPETKILCAVFEDAPDVYMGYLVYAWPAGQERPTIHFSFVKLEYLRSGIFNQLIKAAQIDLAQGALFTHWTFSVDWMLPKYPQLEYQPYLAFFKQEESQNGKRN